MTSFQETGGQVKVNQTYNYDPFGNRWVSPGWIPYVGQTPTSNVFSNNQWASGSGVTYDSAGNQIQISNPSRSFTYDAEGRQLTATINSVLTSYNYDGEGRRVQKIGSSTTTYVYDAHGQLAAEYGGSPSASGTTYLTADHLGSVRTVTSGSTSPTVLERFDYAPFGEELTAGFDGRIAPFSTNQYPTATQDSVKQKFPSKERDSETGLDWFETRYFSSAQGRFTSPDQPFAGQHAEDPQSWNMYAYVRNNPLRYTDPDGRDCFQGWSSCGDYLLGGLKAVANLVPAAATLVNRVVTGGLVGDAPMFQPSNVDQAQGMEAASVMMAISPVAELGVASSATTAATEVPLITRNAAQGAAFQNAKAAEKALTDTDVVQNITVRTQSGARTQIDIVSTNPSGNIALTEAKSSATAPLTPNQAAAHPEIAQSGATVAGKGKAPYVGGTKIPPTKVEVVRPKDPNNQ